MISDRSWNGEARMSIEQSEPMNLDVSSSSASGGRPVSGLLNEATTTAGRKGECVPMFEGQPSASNLFVANLFTYEGYEVATCPQAEPTNSEAIVVDGSVQSEVAATWFITPKASESVTARKPRADSVMKRTIMSWYRTAAIIGTVAALTAPNLDTWTSLASDNSLAQPQHRK